MSNIAIQSAIESPIISGLVSSNQEDISYQIPKSYPISAKYVQVTPSRSDPAATALVAGNSIVFDINRNSFLRKMVIRSTFTATTAVPVHNPIGLKIFSRIELRSNNSVLCTVYDSSLIGKAEKGCDLATSIRMIKDALPHNAASGVIEAVTTSVYCDTEVPNPWSVDNDPRMFFNLRQYESLQLVCYFNSAADMGTTTTAVSLTNYTAKLYTYLVDYDDKTYKMLLAENSPIDSPTQMLCLNNFSEVIAGVVAKTITLPINLRSPIVTLYAYIQRINSSGYVGITSNPLNLLSIKNFSLRVNGVYLYENVPFEIMNADNDMRKGNNGLQLTTVTAFTQTEPGVLCLNFGLDSSRYFNSGALAGVGLNKIELVLNTYDDMAVTDKVVYNAEYWNVVNLDNATSRVSILQSF